MVCHPHLEDLPPLPGNLSPISESYSVPSLRVPLFISPRTPVPGVVLSSKLQTSGPTLPPPGRSFQIIHSAWEAHHHYP